MEKIMKLLNMAEYSICSHSCSRFFMWEMLKGMGPLIPVPCKSLQPNFQKVSDRYMGVNFFIISTRYPSRYKLNDILTNSTHNLVISVQFPTKFGIFPDNPLPSILLLAVDNFHKVC